MPYKPSGRVTLAEQPHAGRYLQPLDRVGQCGEGLVAEPGERDQRLQSSGRVERRGNRRQLNGSRWRDRIDVDPDNGRCRDAVSRSGGWGCV